MNKELIAKRFASAASTYQKEAKAQREIAQRLIEKLRPITHAHPPKRILEVGCGTGHLSEMLYTEFVPDSLYLNDLCEEMRPTLATLTDKKGVEFAAYDADSPLTELPENLDLVASASAVQWFEDLPEFLLRVSKSLKDGGIVAISTFSADNLKEVATTSGAMLRYHTEEELIQMAEDCGYTVLHTATEEIVHYFDTPADVLRHLKRTGVNALSTPNWTKHTLQEFSEKYIERFQTAEGVSLTYTPFFLILGFRC